MRGETELLCFTMITVFDLVVQMFPGKMEKKLMSVTYLQSFNSICSHVCSPYKNFSILFVFYTYFIAIIPILNLFYCYFLR